jgi:hypothetical protein
MSALSKYFCFFDFQGETKAVAMPENMGVRDVAEGFWVDSEFNWCAASQIKYWIPPGQILYVEKEEK